MIFKSTAPMGGGFTLKTISKRPDNDDSLSGRLNFTSDFNLVFLLL